jgi:L-asparaginase
VELRNRIAQHVQRPEVDGIVVTHGTDTIEESAYLNARTIASEKPSS